MVLLWVNNHFNDFELDKQMTNYLDTYDQASISQTHSLLDLINSPGIKLLEQNSMFNQQSLLNITRSVKSHPRTIIVNRSNRDQELPFAVVGGTRGMAQGVFVSRINADSVVDKNGMRVGDEVSVLSPSGCAR